MTEISSELKTILLDKRSEIISRRGDDTVFRSHEFQRGWFHGQISLVEELTGEHICDWTHPEDDALAHLREKPAMIPIESGYLNQLTDIRRSVLENLEDAR